MPTFIQVYNSVMSKVTKTSHHTFDYDTLNELSKGYSFCNDFTFWIEMLSDRKEVALYKGALNDYIVGQIILAQGFYKHAFICLRGFLEQTLFAIHLSTNELHLRQWINSKRDVYWSLIIDENTGIFSKEYINAFCPELDEYADAFSDMAKKVYRECSEFVHGNFHTQGLYPNMDFHEVAFKLWHEKTNVIQTIIIYSLFVRYNEFLNSIDALKNSEPIIIEKIGYIEAIREFYNRGDR